MTPLPMIEEGGLGRPLALLGRLPRLAHHPTCARYDHHLVRPLGVPLCLGCTCMYPGLVASAGGVLLATPAPSMAHGAAAFGAALILIIPTFIQPFVQRRWFKIPSRFALGMGLGLALSTLWLLPLAASGWVMRGAFTIATALLYRMASTLRAKRTDNPCIRCPWGSFPLCAHNLPMLQGLASDPGVPADERAFFQAITAQLEPLAVVAPSTRGPRPPAPRAENVALHWLQP